MKVLFIGGTGTISNACSQLAVKKGIELYLLNRGNHNDKAPSGAKFIQADINDEVNSSKALQGLHFDCVVNWIAFKPEQIERDIRLFTGKTSQYIFISSASVYQKPVTHYLITESTPLANPYWEYSRDKIACEDVLMREHRENAFPMTIIRPAHTYDKNSIPTGFHGNNPWGIIERMRQGKKVIVHGDGTSLWALTHSSDFAKAFVGLLGNSKSVGHAFHITSDEVLNWNQIYEALGRAAGVTPDLIHISTDFLRHFDPWVEGSLWGDKANSVVFDNSKIKRFVPDYVATIRFEEGIKESIEYFESHQEKRASDKEWDALCDKIIAAYELGTAQAKL